MKIALLAALLLFGATTATAQIIPQPVRHEAVAKVTTTTATPGKTVTTTQVSRSVSTVPAAPPAKPLVPPLVSQPHPVAPKPAARVIHHWEPFDIGNQNPRELAAKIRASLAIDATGHAVIDKVNCKPANGYSCGTPQFYLETAQKADDRANIKTFGDLLLVLDRLKPSAPPKGEYWMACLHKGTDGKLGVIWNCMSREFEKLPDGASESAWMDPETGKVVFAQNCTNGVGARVDDCDEQHIWLHADDELHGALIGPEALPEDACRPAIKRAGATGWSNAILDECPRSNCNYSEPLADLREREPAIDWKLQSSFRISFKAETTGEYVIRVPRFVEHTEDEFVYCVLFPDGTQTQGTELKKTSYQSFGWAYIDFPGQEALSTSARAKKGWHGMVHSWIRSEERAFKGARSPIQAVPK